jgi:hypothetical protein
MTMLPMLPGLLANFPLAKAIVVPDKRAPAMHGATVEERFWAKVDKSAGPNACRPWLASVTQSTNRGQFFPESGRYEMCHRMAWKLAHGDILDGMRVLHARGCRPNCCNPAHLRLGSAAQNTDDARREGRLRAGKLMRSEVEAILAQRVQHGMPAHVIGARFGISAQSVENIRKGRAWWWVSGLPPSRKPRPVHPGQLALLFEGATS